MKKLAVSVIGTGYWGKNLIRNFHELGVLHAVCDSNQELSEQYSIKYKVKASSWQDILNNQEIDAVALAVPANMHAKLAQEALLAGKHVFVEKPIALDVNDAQAMCDLAQSMKKVLMVGHVLQYHPAFIKLKKLVDDGQLGKLHYVYSNRLSLGKVRTEEDVLWSFAPHDLSMILSLIKQEPTNITTSKGCYLNGHIADVAITHLSFAGGIKAHVFVSWMHPIKEQKLVVIGDKAMAVFDDTKPWEQKLMLYATSLDWLDGIPQFNKVEGVSVELVQAEPLTCELEHFIDCIVNNQKPVTDGEEAIKVLKVLKGAATAVKERSEHRKKQIYDNVFIHKSAEVDDLVEIGQGSKIWHFSHVLSKTKIGKNCIIGQNVMIGPDVVVGDNCKIQNNVSLYRGVKLGKGVFCGPSSVFTNVNNPRAEVERKDEFRTTEVQDGVTIGANATIVCGVTLGAYCFIGAGAVVTKDILRHALVVGNPARQIGWVSHAGEKLGADLICTREGRSYRVNINNQLEEIVNEHIAPGTVVI